jgi:hypothetical protein
MYNRADSSFPMIQPCSWKHNVLPRNTVSTYKTENFTCVVVVVVAGKAKQVNPRVIPVVAEVVANYSRSPKHTVFYLCNSHSFLV